jgi:hypothetical protein
VREFGVADGGMAVGAGAAVGSLGARLGSVLGGKVVTVSGGSCGPNDGLVDGRGGVVVAALGGADCRGVVEITGVREAGGPIVAFVDALSPLLMTTALAMAPTATTAPATTAVGRQRRSAGQRESP